MVCRAAEILYETIAVSLFARLPNPELFAASGFAHVTYVRLRALT